MAVSFVGSAKGSNTATMPTHQVGDLIVAITFRELSATLPTMATGLGWIQLATATNANGSHRIIYKFAQSTSETVGTHTNATATIVHVYRGACITSFINHNASTAGLSLATLADIRDPTNSWMAAFLGHSSADTAIDAGPENGPASWTLREDYIDANNEAVSFDTNGPMGRWGGYRDQTFGGTAGQTSGSFIVIGDITRSLHFLPIDYGSATGSTSATTAAATHPPNTLLLAAVQANHASAIPAQPTISNSGTALTWTEVDDTTYDPGSGTRNRQRIFKAKTGASPGSITITGASSGANNVVIQVLALPGGDHDTCGNNHSSGTNGAGDPSATLPNEVSTASTVIDFGYFQGSNTVTAPSGHSSLINATIGSGTRTGIAYDSDNASLGPHAWTSTNTGSITCSVEVRQAFVNEISYRSLSTSGTVVASGSVTLVEPTNARPGDLLVALIGIRGSATLTAPSEWIQLVQDLDASIASLGPTGIAAYYTIRGASAPGLVFTRSGGDVAFGRIAAYQPDPTLPDTGIVFDKIGATTRAVSPSTTWSLAAITPVNDPSLIVGMATWSRDLASGVDVFAFLGGNSVPFIERYEGSNSTGGDIGIQIQDARWDNTSTGTMTTSQGMGAGAITVQAAFYLADIAADVPQSVGPAEGTSSPPVNCLGLTVDAGDLVYVLAAGQKGGGGPTPSKPTVSDNKGGAITWTEVSGAENSSDDGTIYLRSTVYRAVMPASYAANLNIIVDSTGAGWVGADIVRIPNGGSLGEIQVKLATSATGDPSFSYNSAPDVESTLLVFGQIYAASTGQFTPPALWTELHDNELDSTRRLYSAYSQGRTSSGPYAWSSVNEVTIWTALEIGQAGTTYNDSVTEAGTAADSQTGLLVTSNARTEAGTAADAVTGTGVFPKALTEAATAADSQTTTGAFGHSLTEAGAAADAVTGTGVFPKAITEAAGAADAPTNLAVFVGAATEAAAAADTQSTTGTFSLSVTEAGAASDASTGDLANVIHNVSITEAGAAADTSVGTVVFATVAVTEAGAAADTSTGLAAFTLARTEAATAADSQTGLLTIAGALTEAGAAADSQTGTVVVTASLTEAGAASDSQTGLGVFPKTLTEAGAATDVQTATGAFGHSVTEAAAAANTQTGLAIFASAVTEVAGAADAPSTLAVFASTITEAATAADTQSTTGSFSLSVTEAGNATDQSTGDIGSVTHNASLTEAGTAVDTPVGTLVMAPSAVSEVAAATDVSSTLVVLAAARTEAATAADTQTGTVAFGAAATTISESASAAHTQTATVALAATVTEAASAADSQDSTLTTGPTVYNVSVTESANAVDVTTGVGGTSPEPQPPVTLPGGGSSGSAKGRKARKKLLGRLVDDKKEKEKEPELVPVYTGPIPPLPAAEALAGLQIEPAMVIPGEPFVYVRPESAVRAELAIREMAEDEEDLEDILMFLE